MATIFQVQNIDILELKQIIRDVISEEINKLKNDLNINKNLESQDNSEPLLSMKDAAAFLQITTVSLYKYIKKGDIKTYRVGKRRKFRKKDLEKYLLNIKSR